MTFISIKELRKTITQQIKEIRLLSVEKDKLFDKWKLASSAEDRVSSAHENYLNLYKIQLEVIADFAQGLGKKGVVDQKYKTKALEEVAKLYVKYSNLLEENGNLLHSPVKVKEPQYFAAVHKQKDGRVVLSRVIHRSLNCSELKKDTDYYSIDELLGSLLEKCSNCGTESFPGVAIP
jgi:hypothetical protein